MSYGVLLLRIVLGLVMAAHGAQKVFGWFGGGGSRGTADMFGRLRFRAPLLMALVAGLSEFGGGLLLAAGLATPLAAAAIVGVMVVAVAVVHWRNGFWITKGGYEYNLLILAAAAGVAAEGPGRFSLDALLGWSAAISGLWWGVASLAVGGLLAAATVVLGRHTPDAGPHAEPQTPVAADS